jgi:hypothetical protein
MKGSMKIDKSKSKIDYSLNINEVLLKSLIVFIMTLLLFGLFLFENYLNLVIFSAVLSLVMFSINWISLMTKVDDLSNKLMTA